MPAQGGRRGSSGLASLVPQGCPVERRPSYWGGRRRRGACSSAGVCLPDRLDGPLSAETAPACGGSHSVLGGVWRSQRLGCRCPVASCRLPGGGDPRGGLVGEARSLGSAFRGDVGGHLPSSLHFLTSARCSHQDGLATASKALAGPSDPRQTFHLLGWFPQALCHSPVKLTDTEASPPGM